MRLISKYRLVKFGVLQEAQVFNSLKTTLEEKSLLISDFSKGLKINKEKMLSELDLFDSANKSSNIFSKLIGSIANLRSASSI